MVFFPVSRSFSFSFSLFYPRSLLPSMFVSWTWGLYACFHFFSIFRFEGDKPQGPLSPSKFVSRTSGLYARAIVWFGTGVVFSPVSGWRRVPSFSLHPSSSISVAQCGLAQACFFFLFQGVDVFPVFSIFRFEGDKPQGPCHRVSLCQGPRGCSPVP